MVIAKREYLLRDPNVLLDGVRLNSPVSEETIRDVKMAEMRSNERRCDKPC